MHYEMALELARAGKIDDAEKKLSVRVLIEQIGNCHAFVYWYDLHLDEKNSISTLNAAHTNHWKKAIQFFNKDYPLEAETSIELDVIQTHTGFEFEINVPQ